MMRFYQSIFVAVLVLVASRAMPAWEIVEDDVLYLRQHTSNGTVTLYCSETGHGLLPVVITWPKPFSAPSRGSQTGAIKLIPTGAEQGKVLWATLHGNTTSVKLDRNADDLLKQLRAIAEENGSLFVRAQAGDGSEMAMEIDLGGYLATVERFEARCRAHSQQLLK